MTAAAPVETSAPEVTEPVTVLRLPSRQPAVRLGSAEDAILTELRRVGGPVPRRHLLSVAIANPSSSRRAGWSRPAGGREPHVLSARARQNAESTLSRALRTLERKGLIVRDVSRAAKQTLVAAVHPPTTPPWEEAARAKEAYAARCEAVSAELAELARSAREQALRLRIERRSSSSELALQRRREATTQMA